MRNIVALAGRFPRLGAMRSSISLLVYALFIPSGSDSLITSDSLTFKARE